MNTKKVLFGFMALAFFAMATVSTTVLDLDDQTTTQVDKKKIGKM